MAVNKVTYGGETLIDLTGDTVTADKLAQGITAHDASGAEIIGTLVASASKLAIGTISPDAAKEVTVTHGLGVTPSFAILLSTADYASSTYNAFNIKDTTGKLTSGTWRRTNSWYAHTSTQLQETQVVFRNALNISGFWNAPCYYIIGVI